MEGISPSEEDRPRAIDFTTFRRDELRPLAQELIDKGDVDNLKKLLAYAEKEQQRLPHNTLYATEWDYWNYSYLRGEINTALQTTLSEEGTPEST